MKYESFDYVMRYPMAVYHDIIKNGKTKATGYFWAILCPITFLADMANLKKKGKSFAECKKEIKSFIDREYCGKTITT